MASFTTTDILQIVQTAILVLTLIITVYLSYRGFKVQKEVNSVQALHIIGDELVESGLALEKILGYTLRQADQKKFTEDLKILLYHHEKSKYVLSYLNIYERLSIGVRLKMYEESVFRRARQTLTVETFNLFKDFIYWYRVNRRRPTAWREFEELSVVWQKKTKRDRRIKKWKRELDSQTKLISNQNSKKEESKMTQISQQPTMDDLSKEWTYTLTTEDLTVIKNILEEMKPISDIRMVDDNDFLTTIEIIQKQIPHPIAKRLIDFRRQSNKYGMLLFKNFPIDPNLPPTPSDGKPSLEKKSSFSEYILLLSMLYLGDPIAYADEKNGYLIQDICPIKEKEETQSNAGSVYLEFHVENGFHPFKPDFLGLYCLKSDHKKIAKTSTASIRNVINTIPGKIVDILRKPLFRMRIAHSFVGTDDVLLASPKPILSGEYSDPEICVNFYGTIGIDEASNEALQYLKNSLERAMIDIALSPGDLLIIDNRIALHARTSFEPKYDGSDRWLQRMFVVSDIRRSMASRFKNSHVCIPLKLELEKPEKLSQ